MTFPIALNRPERKNDFLFSKPILWIYFSVVKHKSSLLFIYEAKAFLMIQGLFAYPITCMHHVPMDIPSFTVMLCFYGILATINTLWSHRYAMTAASTAYSNLLCCFHFSFVLFSFWFYRLSWFALFKEGWFLTKWFINYVLTVIYMNPIQLDILFINFTALPLGWFFLCVNTHMFCGKLARFYTFACSCNLFSQPIKT